MKLYRWLVRPILFRFEAEATHRATVAACEMVGRSALMRKTAGRLFAFDDSRLHTCVAGIDFKSPVTLAAGFDKDARAIEVMGRLGFGAIEIGSVSKYRCAGNAGHPRIWRLPLDRALRTHYGCPNDGADAVAARLRHRHVPVPVGINLVETNTGVPSSAEQASEELGQAIAPFLGLADYLVLNLNCPNVPRGHAGLFDDPARLAGLLASCSRHRDLPPLFLKITPRGSDARTVDAIVAAVEPFPFVKGFILNIPAPEPYALRTPPAEIGAMRGGIAGPLLRAPTNEAIRDWFSRIDSKRHVLFGVGGIASAEDAYETIRLGASLVQLYTAFVYHGPGLINRINRGLCRLLERDGIRHVSEAVGVDNRNSRPH
jgi:dihydroorotate dehydrogenase (fumarate)/dihydroorotate dehydrogenase